MTFNRKANINPHFESVWLSGKSYNILKGGRNSFKSSVIALKLVMMMVRYLKAGEKGNIVVIRKVGNTIRDSVYLKIQWALGIYGLLDQFKMTVSPFKISHTGTGSTFYFYGQDDFQKLKSNDIGNIIAVWYEEAAEFTSQEDFDQTNVTFMRQKHHRAKHVKFFWSFNPPRNPYSWINEWVDSLEDNEDYLIHQSSYLNDELGFVTDQMLADIERIKENDYDYYRYIYLGEPVGLGTNVYNIDSFHKAEAIPQDERVIGQLFASDTGHQQSATTCLHAVLTNKRKLYLVDTYYYSPAGRVKKKAPSVLSKELHTFVHSQSRQFPNVPILQMTDLTTPIRSDDYIKAINEGLSLFEMQLGVSAGMFTFDGRSMKTATEIVSENSDTYQMRNSIVALVEQSLKELVVSIFELARAYDLYNGQVPDIDDISINLDDGVFTDRNAELNYWIKVVNAGFGTQLQAIEKVLNVTPEKAKAIKIEIDSETVDAVNRSEDDVAVYGE
ncbi:TPA: PBSX family phage terminase large subunit [Streptococcus suis]